eukprot:TRINITY_DN18898_c0_g1_i1.p1 TRINITY_DN18898_c0_g1~~TRINITY_DN18898_c0_g1_i1.p1  ORF type:complete len:125 (+),score=39.53 TRINITY_DN18898_c0_g1_i1:81-455(+)
MWGILSRKKQLASEQGTEVMGPDYSKAASVGSVSSRDSVGEISVCSSDCVSDASSAYTRELESEVSQLQKQVARLQKEAAAMKEFYLSKDKIIEQQRTIIEKLQHNMSDDEFSDDDFSDSDSDE